MLFSASKSPEKNMATKSTRKNEIRKSSGENQKENNFGLFFVDKFGCLFWRKAAFETDFFVPPKKMKAHVPK